MLNMIRYMLYGLLTVHHCFQSSSRCEDLQKGAEDLHVPEGCEHCGPAAMRECGYNVTDVIRNDDPEVRAVSGDR